MALILVRSLGLKPSFHLTTGTFNHFVKDPISTPPERRFSGTPAIAGAPRNLLSWRYRQSCLYSIPNFRSGLMPSQTPETNLSKLPRTAALCQCGYLEYPFII